MIDVLPLEDPFGHVSTREVITPLVGLFYAVTRIGRENSVVLGGEARGVGHAAAPSSGRDGRILAEFSADCRQAVAFAQRIGTGQFDSPSPALLALAREAARQCAARKDEDVQAWAERLARDAGNATD